MDGADAVSARETYFKVSVSGTCALMFPTLAVTVRVYVPGRVLVPPPQ
jgi:hypothetical protein